MLVKRVNHGIADEIGPVGWHAFGTQISDSTLLAHEQHVRDLISKDAVDLFGHGTVKRSQTCLHVCNQRTPMRPGCKLGGDQSAGQCRVHVSGNYQRIRIHIGEHRLKAFHDLCRLLGMRARTDAEEDIGPRQLKVSKKGVGHLCIVMLPGVHKYRHNFLGPLRACRVEFRNCFQNRRGFHEIWTRAYHDENLHC